MAGGRPPKYTKKFVAELVVRFKRYIEETELPIIADFAYQNGLYKQFFYDREEFSDLIKIAISKKEAALERNALNGTYNPTMSVFSLKQLGWKDKQEVEHSGKMEIGSMTIEQAEQLIKQFMSGGGT